VTAVVMPFVGTGWRRRRLRYWWGRIMALAVFVGVIALQLYGWLAAIGDDIHGGQLNGQGWRIAVAGVLGVIGGLWSYAFKKGIPFFRFWEDPRLVVKVLYFLPMAAYVLLTGILTPGLFLWLAIDWLRPTLPHEDTVRADLDAQLRAGR
jgi:hypothetical protein